MADACPPDDAFYEHAACGLLVAETDGLIRRANATICRWLGYEADELIGKVRVQDLLTVGGRLFHQTHINPILQLQGSVAEVQVEMRHRDQTRISLLINIVRRRHGDSHLDELALLVGEDRRAYERELLKARQTAEAALEARHGAEAKLHEMNEQLSLADRRKDEFIATLSHELRNPLAPMHSALEVMKLRSSGNAALEPVLPVFERQLKHITHLVDDLMEISRITEGRMALRCAPLDLGTVVRAAAADVAALIDASGHTLSISLPPQALVVDGDATRLTQVVVNLLTNAAKYTPRAGRIWLEAARHEGQAQITVRDDGIGIPQQSLASIFDMFSQLEPALDRSQGGLGIGLALVKGIVMLHGGDICAVSEGVGRGSEFRLRLPLSAAGIGADASASAPVSVEALRVLVVDDNADAADTLVMALELLGCEAKAVYNALDGLAQLAEFRPQAALLDIGLPDMNGYEMARRVRAADSGAAITLIAATGWGQSSDKERAREAGFDHHLTKPIDFDQLQTILTLVKQFQSPVVPKSGTDHHFRIF
ncbi:hybrid sensor histidine kinase/response regulator [Massilia soli]|uniref:histidine kinase n=1 Tax=Massilia soli TaxID=2792854 RepID=A0ABS7SPL8_9BURK|nr:ATP-binding protein [Massilia soli]MBZ2207740.1 response regulator [Massilia soli]